jgi:hypothetical protein
MSSPLSRDATVLMPRRPRWLCAIEGVGHPRAAMLLWGLAIGFVGALVLLAVTPLHWRHVYTRGPELQASMVMLSHGGPLLLARQGSTGSYYAVGFGDALGTYVFIPLLSQLFGVAEPMEMVRYLYVALVGLTAAIYPVVFYRLTHSLFAGLAAPFMLLVCMMSLGFLDIYWVPAWGMLALLPVLYLTACDWRWFSLPALVALSLAGGWVSSIRNDSGLGIAIAAAIVLLLRRWQWWRALMGLALLVLAYMSIATFLIAPIRAHREQWLGHRRLVGSYTSSHPLWFPLYAGLGYLPNDLGVRYGNGVGAGVEQKAAGVPFLSAHYEAKVRSAYFRFVREHPLEYLRQYGAKAFVTTADTALYLLFVVLTMPAMLLLGAGRGMRRRWVLLTLPPLLVTFLPTMVAIPNQGYEEGLYGTVGVLGILGLCWALGQLEGAARTGGSARSALAELRASLEDRRGLPWRSIRISGAALAALILLAVGGHFVRRDAERWQGGSSGVLIDDGQGLGRAA